jgi:hypothetical protein
LLSLTFRRVTFVKVDRDGTLNLGFGKATLSIPPHPTDGAWRVGGPHEMFIECLPGGEYLVVCEAKE